MRARLVEPEILDSLSVDDPAGKRSRRDLRMINSLMGNFRWVENALRVWEKKRAICELGAGEGLLLRRLLRAGDEVVGVDLAPRPVDLPPSAGWKQGDLFEVLGSMEGAVVATLFLHHFENEALKQLGSLLSQCELLCFVEPWRSRVALVEGYALFPFVNEVTRHDMIVSIRAGFRRGELPELLGLDASWQVWEETTVLGAYRLLARRV